MGKARQFKFCVMINTRDYGVCMISYPGKGCVQSHVNYLNFVNKW